MYSKQVQSTFVYLFEYDSHSAAARAGVENMTRTLALEWAHTGTRLNVLVPGAIVFSQKSVR